jgi:Fis family transcriptional regulator
MSNPEMLLDNEQVTQQETQLQPVEQKTHTLRDCVEETMQNYFADLEGHDASNVYDMVLSEVEAPLLQVVMQYTHNNQCKAAQVMGINRGTLRKKLKRYGLL